MKKICILTEESILGGSAKTGVGELCDSLAYSLNSSYEVSLVTTRGYRNRFVELMPETTEWIEHVYTSRMGGTDYYLIEAEQWENLLPVVIDKIQPDILHSFTDPNLIKLLHYHPKKLIYTIDNGNLIKNPNILYEYDIITTISNGYATELLQAGNELSDVLQKKTFLGLTPGILTEFFNPAIGHFIPFSFSINDLTGKEKCKKQVCNTYNLSPDKWLAVMTARLVKEKGIQQVINALPKLKELNGELILIGMAYDEIYQQLDELAKNKEIIWIRHFPDITQCLQILSAGDFYLTPSLMEPCGLMPMTASRYGCIPIATQTGGLCDNMNKDNAILIKNNNLELALLEASFLYKDKDALQKKQKVAMQYDFSWETRKIQYIKMYEGEE